ncbi:MAG: exosortase K, partial [Myxococcota bacterium]
MSSVFQNTQNFVYLFWLLSVCALKMAYAWLGTTLVVPFLWGTQVLVAWFSGTTYVWIPEQGYLRSDRLILLHRECAGFHFFLIALCIWLWLKRNPTHAKHPSKHRAPKPLTLQTGLSLLATGIAICFVMTLFANFSRITILSFSLTSPSVLEAFPSWMQRLSRSHQAVGMWIYLWYLWCFGWIVQTHERHRSYARQSVS